jgi:hypothetical protein
MFRNNGVKENIELDLKTIIAFPFPDLALEVLVSLESSVSAL